MTSTTTIDQRVTALQRDTGWAPITALLHLAKGNGHKLGLCRLTPSGAGLGYMARCTVPACGASVWERPDLAGGHGAAPVVRCIGEVAS